MKLTALMIVINEEDYVYYSLRSVESVVDEFIIVEGAAADRFGVNAVRDGILTGEGLSTDRTEEEIRRFMNESRRDIKYRRLGWSENVNALRDQCLRLVDPDTDYCLVLDADAAFDDVEIAEFREILSRNPQIWMVETREFMFYLDFQHILTVSPEKLRFCNCIDSGLLWRYVPEVSMIGQRPYIDGTKMEELMQRASITDLKTVSNWACLLSGELGVLSSYHYGWVHSPKKIEQHLLRWAHAQIDLVKRGGGDEKLCQWCSPILKSSDDEILSYYQAYHKIYTQEFDSKVGEHVAHFEGRHPKIMESHPFYGKNKAELGWGGDWNA
jgi:glycosyltransferase involved in cell wall biosynthesis